MIPHPEPLPMPAPPTLLWALSLLTFFLHLLPMNFVLGGSIIAAVARIRGRAQDLRLARAIGNWMPTIVAAAITFGVAPLLFLQALYGRLFFPSTIVMGWFWLAVVPILILAYYATYLVAFRDWKPGAFIAPVLFLGIAFIYANNMSLMLRPATFLRLFVEDGRGIQLNLGDPTLVPRFLHMLLGACAVAGMLVALYGTLRRDRWIARHGALWFLISTTFNVLVGVWWLEALPRDVSRRFVGEDAAATTALVAGIAFAFGTVLLMLFGRVKWAAATSAVTLVAMVLTRDEVRSGMLSRGEFAQTTWIEPQWDAIAIFAVLLVSAIAATAWMGMLLRRRRV